MNTEITNFIFMCICVGFLEEPAQGLAVDVLTGKVYFTYGNSLDVINTKDSRRSNIRQHLGSEKIYGVVVDVVYR